jgi:hypothetical protein
MTTGFVDRDKGKSVISTQYQSTGGQFYSSYAEGLTATGTSSQANALPLNNSLNRVTTAPANSGVVLPPSGPGLSITIINATATTLQVYGKGSDTINAAAAATGVPLTGRTGGTVATFYSTAMGAWHMMVSA